MDMSGRIRPLHVRDKLSEGEMARRTGLSRNTVSNWRRAQVAEWRDAVDRSMCSTYSAARLAENAHRSDSPRLLSIQSNFSKPDRSFYRGLDSLSQRVRFGGHPF